MSRPTIFDVARAAGVSKSTVSRVLSGDGEYIRAETRQQVERAIAELQYRPSVIARSLVTKRTNSVGLLISDVGNPFYPEVIHGVEDTALSHDYDVFLCNTNYNLERGMKLVRSLIAKNVDGVLIMSSSMSNEWVVELSRHGIPTVTLDWELRSVKGAVGVITVDFETGIRTAVEHLIELGHRKFAHISGPLHLRTSRLRRDAFLKSLARHDIPSEQVTFIEGNLQIEGGAQALAQLIDLPKRQRPTAAFAANDLTALGLLWAAQARGLRIPHDLSVVGLDDILLASKVSPPLTTVALPKLQIGKIAMQMLLELLQVDEPHLAPVRRNRVKTHLIVRQSTTPITGA